MLRPTSIFQLVVLPYLSKRHATVVGCARMPMDYGLRGQHAPDGRYAQATRYFCSSSRRQGRSRQKVSYSTLEQATSGPVGTAWVPPILDGVPWGDLHLPPKPPPRIFRPPLPPPRPDQEPPPDRSSLIPNVGSMKRRDSTPTLDRPPRLSRSSMSSSKTKHITPDQEPSETLLVHEMEHAERPDPSPSDPRPRKSRTSKPKVSELDVVSSRTPQEILDSSKRQSFAPENRDLDSLPPLARTALIAMRKIVNVHQSETERSKRNAVPLGQRVICPPSLPPLVNTLLILRQYNLAVSHILSNPHLATSDEILDIVASRLEKSNQAELAHRVRAVMDDNRRFSINYKLSAPSLPSLSDPEQPPGFWDMASISIPPDPLATYSPTWTDRQKVTHYLNSELRYLIKTRLSHHLAASARGPPTSPASQTLQPHGPGLHHLRDMMNIIDRYRRRWGFQPDRVTANLILKAWLNCMKAPLPSNPYRQYVSSEGSPKISKRDQTRGPRLGGMDLMVIFRGVASAMMESVEAIDMDTEKVPSEIDYKEHVRPFSLLFYRALREADHRAGMREVARWSERVFRYLDLLRRYRYAARQQRVNERKAQTRAQRQQEQKRVRDESRGEYEKVKEALIKMRQGQEAEDGEDGQGRVEMDDGDNDQLVKLFPDSDPSYDTT